MFNCPKCGSTRISTGGMCLDCGCTTQTTALQMNETVPVEQIKIIMALSWELLEDKTNKWLAENIDKEILSIQSIPNGGVIIRYRIHNK